MATDGGGPSLGVERDLAGIVGDLTPWPPQAGAGVPTQSAAGEAHHAGDERPPVGVEAGGRENPRAGMVPPGMGVAEGQGGGVGWGRYKVRSGPGLMPGGGGGL